MKPTDTKEMRQRAGLESGDSHEYLYLSICLETIFWVFAEALQSNTCLYNSFREVSLWSLLKNCLFGKHFVQHSYGWSSNSDGWMSSNIIFVESPFWGLRASTPLKSSVSPFANALCPNAIWKLSRRTLFETTIVRNHIGKIWKPPWGPCFASSSCIIFENPRSKTQVETSTKLSQYQEEGDWTQEM